MGAKPIFTLGLNDLDACLELDELVMGGFWSRSQWEEELANSMRLCLGLKQSSHLYAIACGMVLFEELHLNIVFVHPSFRRAGNAKRLVLELFRKAIDGGAKCATLEVSSLNLEAQCFYKDFGFKTKGIRKNYYRNGGDALIQWTNLVANTRR